MTNSPEGTRKDLLPPSKIDQDAGKPRSGAQEDTLLVINMGILPHSNDERDAIAELLKLSKSPRGVLTRAERIASTYNYVEEGKLPSPTAPQMLAQSAGFDPFKDIRPGLIKERQNEVVATIADHMLDRVEDSNYKLMVMKALRTTLKTTTEGTTVSDLDDLSANDTRALLDLVRFYEVKEYAENPQFEKSRMDKSLHGEGFKGIMGHVRYEIGDRTVQQVQQDIEEYLKLERGRLLFWIDHLVGHEAQPAEPGKPAERLDRKGLFRMLDHLVGHREKPATLGKVAVSERIGLADGKEYDVSDRIWNRLTRIASTDSPISDSDTEKKEK